MVRRGKGLRLLILISGLAAVLFLNLDTAWAKKIVYSYLDERGNLVATDRWEEVPERYRDRVKTTEWNESNKPSSAAPSLLTVSGREEAFLQFIDQMPPTILPGLSAYRSVILIAGFLGIVLFYGAGQLTGSAFLRLLMPWAVGFFACGTLYFMFVSDLGDRVAARSGAKGSDSVVHQFQQKGKQIQSQQQQRANQLDQTPSP